MIVNKNFTLLLAGQLVSQVGDKFHMIAVAFWVLETTGSTAKMGVVLAASLVPSLVAGLFSGAFIDRYNKKNIIVGADLIRGIVLVCFAMAFAQGQVNFFLVLVLQLVLSVNAAFFDPAIPAVIPGIVGRSSLARANALCQVVNGFAMIGGALLGGMALSAFGYFWVFAINGISFILSAGFESLIEIPALKKEKKTTLVAGIRQGYGYLFRNPSLLAILFWVLVIHFFVGGMEVFMPVIADQIGKNGPENLGIFQAAFGGGTIAGAFVLSFFPVTGKERLSLFSSVFIMGLIQAALFLIRWEAPGAVLGFALGLFFWSMAMIRAAVSFKTLIQELADEDYRGRVFAMASTIGNAAIPGAMTVSGMMMTRFDPQGLLLGTGLVLMVLSLITFYLNKERWI